MTIKYRLSNHLFAPIENCIEAVDVIRETAKTVTLKVKSYNGTTFYEKHELKTIFDPLFDTWAEAHKKLVDQQYELLLRLEEDIRAERSKLTDFKAMQPTDFKAL